MTLTSKDMQNEIAVRYNDQMVSMEHLGCALGGEVGELLNQIKKLNRDNTKEEFDKILESIQHEGIDVVFYIMALFNKKGWDFEEAWYFKNALNTIKYNFDETKIPSREFNESMKEAIRQAQRPHRQGLFLK